jgi:uncharacterized membrane protein YhaH (DUF805 family)
MRNSEIMPMIRHGLGNVGNFSGRDPRIKFWPYCGFLYLSATVLNIISLMIVLLPFLNEMQSNFEGVVMPSMGLGIKISIGITIIMAISLAAAVTRRLHDRNLRGYWALIPLAFLLVGLWNMSSVFQSVTNLQAISEDVLFDSIMTAGIFNMIYIITLAMLCVILSLKGDAGPNRFGVPSELG